MPRLGHGKAITEQDVAGAQQELAEAAVRSTAAFALTSRVDGHNFDYLFPVLQEDEANLLPQTATMPALLKNLGATMVDADESGEDSPIPAAYTYFGQFVDHDITLEIQQGFGSGTMDELLDPAMVPLSPERVRNALRNMRTTALDLDSVYGLPAPRQPDNGAKMRLGVVSPTGGTQPPLVRPPGKSDDNDVPREPRAAGNIEHDRAAVIGDPRNDENTIIAQLHVAFLKAHNVLIDQGLPFDAARRLLSQHYQHIVIHDFLPRIAEPEIVADIATNGNRWFDPLGEPFMPLEFAAAGYRFGHSMVRATYNFNLNFRSTPLERLFTFTALSGELGDFNSLPENWIIEWENIIGDGPTVMNARRIDTRVARIGGRALFNLQTPTGQTESPPDAARLPVRNLLRGYRLRLPTGQAVAQLLGLPVLSKDDVLAVAGSPEQLAALEAGGFDARTPLWFYLLAEARHHHGGARLGPLGSTLVAEVLVGLVRRTEDSILRQPAWTPSLRAARPGTFELADLLRLAGVLPGAEPPRTYVVRRGDTLSGIARAQLGNPNRWTEIFLLNRTVIRHPDRIVAGQVLVLPPAQPTGPIPRLYVVRRGDTLSGIAKSQLGDANRWPEIFARNRDIIANPDRIIPDQVLVLPN
jgi:nucleoid-associated protein YgaU